MHDGSILSLGASADGRYVFTSGQDGLLFALEVKDKNTNGFIDELVVEKEGVIMI